MALAVAYIVGVATSAASTNAAEPTGTTTDHCAEKVGIGSIVPSGKLLIVSKFCLNQIKLLLADCKWKIRFAAVANLTFRFDSD